MDQVSYRLGSQRVSIDDFIEEKSSVNEDVVSESRVEYDYNKTMKLVKKTVTLNDTYSWLEPNSEVKSILLEQIDDLIN